MSKYLVSTPAATEFLDMAHVDSGLRVILGDPKEDAAVGPDIVRSQIALREGAKKVAGLANDPTRTEVDRHQAGKKVAADVVDALTKTKTAIGRRATELRDDAFRKINLEFGPSSDRAVVHSEVRGWIREVARTPEGLEKIKNALEESDDLAAVLWHSPRFLLGLPEETYQKLRLDALEVRRPELFAALKTSGNLDELSKRYDTAVRKVEASFYGHAIALRAGKRVEV